MKNSIAGRSNCSFDHLNIDWGTLHITESELEVLKQKYCHPKFPIGLLKYICAGIQLNNCGTRELIRDSFREHDDTGSDINMHIGVHGGWAGLMGYGLPKMDLGVAWFKNKHIQSFSILEEEITKLVNNRALLASHVEGASRISLLQINLLKYKTFLDNLSISGLHNDWESIVMADIAIEDDKLGGQEYTFTAHLAPFCLDADDGKLKPAYERRRQFLVELGSKFCCMMEDTISELTNVTQTLISEGISPNVAMQIWPHDTIMQEIQKGDANKRVAITHIMNNQAGTIETYSLIECWKLMVEINPQGAGSTDENFIIERICLRYSQTIYDISDKEILDLLLDQVNSFFTRITQYPKIQQWHKWITEDIHRRQTQLG